MNQSLTRNRPGKQTIGLVCVDIEYSQIKARIAQQRLLSSSYAEVRCVRCDVRDGVLYLRGQVTSFYFKQVTQEAVRSIEGIDAVSNCLEVSYPGRSQKVADLSVNDCARNGNIKMTQVL